MQRRVSGMPLILDETKRAKKKTDVKDTIYGVANGRGRSRGSKKGLALSYSWRTILLSTGEQRATSFTEDGGTRARVLSVWGSPFGRQNEATGAMVNQLNLGIKRHYGHAGRRMVEWLLENRARWGDWKAEYRALAEKYLQKAGDDPVAGRYSEYFAVLELAGRLAHEALELPWAYRNPIERLWDELMDGAQDADQALAALEYVTDWAHAHQGEFHGRWEGNLVGAVTPLHGLAGRWDKHDWGFIGFLKPRLKQVLAEGGWDLDATLRLWADRGWLELDEGRLTKKGRMGGACLNLVQIRRRAVEAIHGEQPQDEGADMPLVGQLAL